jgi:hypothetical protein
MALCRPQTAPEKSQGLSSSPALLVPFHLTQDGAGRCARSRADGHRRIAAFIQTFA